MIDLTPLEVRQKKGDFRRTFRGYDAELVDDFLDMVADRMEDLVKENLAFTDIVAELEQELEDFREKEAALSDALMAAQKHREDARAHAEKESELMIREAKLRAEDARQDAARSLAREEETLRQVRARRSQLVQSFRRLLERELNELEVIEKSLELAGEAPRRERDAGTRSSSRTRARKGGEDGDVSESGPGASQESGAGPASGASENGPTQEEAGESSQAANDAPDDAQEDWLQSLVDE